VTQTSTGGGRSAEQRRKRAAELQARQQREERRRRMLAVVGATVGVLVVLGVVLWVALGSKSSKNSTTAQIVPAAVTGSVTKEVKPQQVKDDSGIPGVVAYNTGNWPGNGNDVAGALQHDHVAGPVQYTETPPVGGPHSATWMNAGVYTKPIPNERAVHNLEHGAVWITYRPNLATSEVKKLVELVGKQSLINEPADTVGVQGQQNRYMDLSPWKDNSLPSPIVITAWGHQLGVDSASDSRLQKFIDVFRSNKKYTPELGSSVDGIPVQTGGRASQYGGTKANPAGAAPSGSGM